MYYLACLGNTFLATISILKLPRRYPSGYGPGRLLSRWQIRIPVFCIRLFCKSRRRPSIKHNPGLQDRFGPNWLHMSHCLERW